MPTPDSTKLGSYWKALLICPNRSLSSELSPLLAQLLPSVPTAELPLYPNRAGLVEILSAQPSNVCFLDVTTDRERGMAVLTDLLAIDAGIKVVALMGGSEPDLILRCLRQGATEFLIRPLTAEQFQPVLDRLAKFVPAANGKHDQAKVFCVMPAKGACGASTIACSLAFQLRRLGSKRVLLADLDPLTGTISFLLKLKSTYSFIDAVTRSNTLDADLWKGLITTSQGIDVLLSPDMPADGLAELSSATPILDYCRQAYEAVVLDCGSAYGEWSLSLARHCDELLLVTTNELPALQATQRVLSYLDRNRVGRAKTRLVVNRFSREVGLNKEMIETALRMDVFHLIPSDYESVQRALMEGRPIPPNTSFGKSLSNLADRLSGREPPEPQPRKASGLGGLFSLFSR